MKIGHLSKLIVARKNPVTLVNAARTATAALLSYLIALLLGSPEPYWPPIVTLIVVQSTLGAALPISVQRLIGTAIGAAMGAATATYFPGSVWVFGLAIFLIGVLCAVLHLDRGAYRYASITVAIVMLITRSTSAWIIGVHRFLEVSLGISVALIISALWPEAESEHCIARHRA